MVQPTLRFTADVESMYGNIDLEGRSEEELLDLIEETYDIPRDCVSTVEVF